MAKKLLFKTQETKEMQTLTGYFGSSTELLDPIDELLTKKPLVSDAADEDEDEDDEEWEDDDDDDDDEEDWDDEDDEDEDEEDEDED